jgi:hypothetical protein
VPRHMADQGYARIETNDAHGIKAGDPLMFHSIAEIAAVIEQLLMKHKIKVHRGQNTRQYIEVE